MIAAGIDTDSLASLSEPTESDAKENEAKAAVPKKCLDLSAVAMPRLAKDVGYT